MLVYVGGVIATVVVAALIICYQKRRSRVGERDEDHAWNNEQETGRAES